MIFTTVSQPTPRSIARVALAAYFAVAGTASPAAVVIPTAPAPVAGPTLVSEITATAVMPTPGSRSVTFASANAGSGFASFNINAFGSLDGDNAWRDVFTLSLNGTNLLSGTYDMGGGGGNRTYYLPDGASITAVSFGGQRGGLATFATPIQLAAGSNTLGFTYTGIKESIWNERWNVSNLNVSGPLPPIPAGASMVPEPATWAMVIIGFGLIGASMRRRRTAMVASSC